jgi:acetyltransferase-like isoleucine patch superfamily enzyme
MRVLDRVASRLFDRRIEDLVHRTVSSELVRRESVHDQEALLYRYLVHGNRSRLHIDPTAVVNDALFNLSSGEITVGPYAFFGHRVAVLTGTHDFSKFGRERQTAIPKSGRDVVIGEGAWLASLVLVLGPCRIGPHAVVGAGSLVIRDVEPYTVVAGQPARLLRRIEPPTSSA